MTYRTTYSRRRHDAIFRAIPATGPFAAVDPGVHGAGVVFGPDDSVLGVAPLRNGAGWAALGSLLVDYGVSLVVLEAQYVGTSSGDSLRLAFAAGELVGQLSGFSPLLSVLQVYPATWQGQMLGRGRRNELKDRALARCKSSSGIDVMAYRSAEDRYGVADAWCLGEWWATTRRSHA